MGEETTQFATRYSAAVNPWMLRRAGEVADGVHVHPIGEPGYLRRHVVPNVLAGARSVGRDAGAIDLIVPVMTIVALSALWEILESWVAQLVSPELGAAYLGAQGDVWDAQKDMTAAFCGALLWLGLSIWARRRSARTTAEPVGTSA